MSGRTTGLSPSVLSIYGKSKGIKYKSTLQRPFPNPPHWTALLGTVWAGREPLCGLEGSRRSPSCCLGLQSACQASPHGVQGVGWAWAAVSSRWARSTGLLPQASEALQVARSCQRETLSSGEYQQDQEPTVQSSKDLGRNTSPGPSGEYSRQEAGRVSG